MLSVEHLQAAYGPAQVLFDITFSIGGGEVVALLGRNGMGKTTTIRTIMGLLPAAAGVPFSKAYPSSGCPHTGSRKQVSASCPRVGKSFPR